jgi:hypothetical protein
LIADMVRHFADRRYLRIDGRPLFLLYRPHLVPDAAETFARWRRRIEEQTGEVPLLLMAQSFNDFDPTPYGLDGAIEFPPHKYGNFLPEIQGSLEILDPEFSGSVRSYADLVVVAARTQPKPPFKLMRTVVPSWDNDARRPGRGLIITGSTPALFQEWLEDSIDHALADPLGSEPLVFINAWNEWTEGAYLEPDIHFGAAYLNAISRAVQGLRLGIHRRRVLLVGHDAVPCVPSASSRTGEGVRHDSAWRWSSLADGDLIDDYRSVALVTVMAAADSRMPDTCGGGRSRVPPCHHRYRGGRASGAKAGHAGFGVV